MYVQFRGSDIEKVDETWVFVDTGEPVMETWKQRPCGHCGEHNTKEGHDACLGTLPGVMNACCGHGYTPNMYVQFTDGTRVGGEEAALVIQKKRKNF